MALEIRSLDDIHESGWARILLTGAPKISGKTVAVGTTAPQPLLFINCDGDSAQMTARRFGGKADVLDVTTPEELIQACMLADQMCREEKYRTVCLDTFTLLVNMMLVPIFRHRHRNDKDASYAVYRSTKNAGTDALRRLLSVNAHLIITAHLASETGALNLEGQLKEDVPGIVHDRVHMVFDTKLSEDEFPTKRAFLIGSHGSGLCGGRHVDTPQTIPPNVTELIRKLGYTP